MMLRAFVARIFISGGEIRPGWRAALYAATLSLGSVIGVLAAFHGFRPPGRPIPPETMLLFECVATAFALGATALMGRLEGRSFWSYGLGGTNRFKLAAAGWVTGFACLSLLLLGMRAAGVWAFDGVAQHGASAIGYGACWLLVFCLVGVGEEVSTRGYPITALSRWLGFWPAALIMSALFGLFHLHNPGESPAAALLAFSSGLVFCVLLRATGSLWAGIGFHCGWDWAQSGFYGTADSGLTTQGHVLASHTFGDPLWSGGTAGPEGSILAIPAFALGVLLLAAVARRKTRTFDVAGRVVH
jgi:membrane protease YdiL (CAAX protease family)